LRSVSAQAPFGFVAAAIFAVALNNARLPETKPPPPPQSAGSAAAPPLDGAAALSGGSGGGVAALSAPPPPPPRSLVAEFGDAAAQWRPLLADRNVRAAVLSHTAYWFVAAGAQVRAARRARRFVHGGSMVRGVDDIRGGSEGGAVFRLFRLRAATLA
jgi:hypothetical protein